MTTGEKLDLYKLHKADYVAKKTPVFVDPDPARYLAIEGRGEPGGPAFETAVGALYGMAFTIKMTRKMAGKGDYAVCKLEAQWWHDGDGEFGDTPREEWRWRLMIRTPEFVEDADLREAAAKLVEKKKGECTERVTLESLDEGRCVQMLHVGPYDREQQTIEEMRRFAEAEGLRLRGRHHEIYLSDPRRVAAEKLKTILRRPISK